MRGVRGCLAISAIYAISSAESQESAMMPPSRALWRIRMPQVPQTPRRCWKHRGRMFDFACVACKAKVGRSSIRDRPRSTNRALRVFLLRLSLSSLRLLPSPPPHDLSLSPTSHLPSIVVLSSCVIRHALHPGQSHYYHHSNHPPLLIQHDHHSHPRLRVWQL